MLQTGSVLDGKYRILSELGHGGRIRVFLALDERAGRTWAVKEIRKDIGSESEASIQGQIEYYGMLKSFDHPAIPKIADIIDKDDRLIIIMDYTEGRSLQSVLDHEGAQDPERVIEWSKQLCDVLGYLHSRKPAIIFEEMNPLNVMLRPDGQLVLIDFGHAHEYKHSTTCMGKRGYAPPEQFGGIGPTDARTDIYCLGATMYHMLTGHSPADTQFIVYPVGDLVPALAGSGLEKVVARCCEPDRANRYQNCAELMYDLDHVHDGEGIATNERHRNWRRHISHMLDKDYRRKKCCK